VNKAEQCQGDVATPVATILPSNHIDLILFLLNLASVACSGAALALWLLLAQPFACAKKILGRLGLGLSLSHLERPHQGSE